jgi:hypothetical protein
MPECLVDDIYAMPIDEEKRQIFNEFGAHFELYQTIKVKFTLF